MSVVQEDSPARPAPNLAYAAEAQAGMVLSKFVVSNLRRRDAEIANQHPSCRLYHGWRTAQIKFHFFQAPMQLQATVSQDLVHKACWPIPVVARKAFR